MPTQYYIAQQLDHLDDDGFWPDPALREVFRTEAEALRTAARAQTRSRVEIAFGTDAGMFPYTENWKEFPTLVANGLSHQAALRAATSTAAALLDRPDLGHLTPGATADVVAVPGDPFTDITALGRVDLVMQDGHLHHAPDPDS